MRVVLDTNILVSALITPFGNSARILDMVLLGELQILYDDRILSEYWEVLLRRKFSFEKRDVDDLLFFIETDGIKITATPVDKPLIDEDDIPFIEVAISGMTDALITGNKRHFKVKGKAAKQINIMTPEEYLKFWRQKK